jgi:hypothetical protein
MVKGGWMGGGRTLPAEPGDVVVVAADELAQLCAAGLAACHVDRAESIGWLPWSSAVSALCFWDVYAAGVWYTVSRRTLNGNHWENVRSLQYRE